MVRAGERFEFIFKLSGDLAKVHLPPASAISSRRDELWKKTCFEVFISPAGSESYWELNLSPSGDWNCYAFDSYRKGMHVENHATIGPIAVKSGSTSFELRAALSLSRWLTPEQSLNISATAVIELAESGPTYWAVRHMRDEPDFHLRESFVI